MIQVIYATKPPFDASVAIRPKSYRTPEAAQSEGVWKLFRALGVRTYLGLIGRDGPLLTEDNVVSTIVNEGVATDEPSAKLVLEAIVGKTIIFYPNYVPRSAPDAVKLVKLQNNGVTSYKAQVLMDASL